MAAWLQLAASCVVLIAGAYAKAGQQNPAFGKNYGVVWGADHVTYLNGGKEVQLQMDKASGSRFDSNLFYTSGFFHMRIKLPWKDSAGVVTAFYLSSDGSSHDEVDFEFLGNREGKPYTLQTNVFASGKGNREQRIHLWFDPTSDFHDYKILWNQYQIVFFVDNVPIRVYKNKGNAGVGYPYQPMKIIGSIWDGEDWATDGGKTKINWAQAPFSAYFRGFDVDGCPSGVGCSRRAAWWTWPKFSHLNSVQQRLYHNVKKKYMTYDYCSDKARYPTPPPECPQ